VPAPVEQAAVDQHIAQESGAPDRQLGLVRQIGGVKRRHYIVLDEIPGIGGFAHHDWPLDIAFRTAATTSATPIGRLT
jgi:hypothetical protein